jgi:outer membrane protein assembly factor BamB
VVKTNEINLADGDEAALAKIGRSLLLKIVSATGADGTVYIGSSDGRLYAIR